MDLDQGQIEQVLLNLYVNAWQAMPDGGDLFLQTENAILEEDFVNPYDIEPGRFVKISITDSGIGMDIATQQRIFDPFFTTKEKDRGTGLGLASAYGIIKNHDGIILVSMVILDMIMPDMSGEETYAQLKEINPSIKSLLSSGYSMNGKTQAILNKGCSGFIQKPINLTILSQKIKEILGQK